MTPTNSVKQMSPPTIGFFCGASASETNRDLAPDDRGQKELLV
jgi:hypothetical protein